MFKETEKEEERPTHYPFYCKAANLMSGKVYVEKYEDPGNPVVSTHIRGVLITNIVIDLEKDINIMTLHTMHQLGIPDLRPTPTVLELTDRSRIKLEGALDDEMVSLESWEYSVEFFVL